jgi:hypothetical protein
MFVKTRTKYKDVLAHPARRARRVPTASTEARLGATGGDLSADHRGRVKLVDAGRNPHLLARLFGNSKKALQ